MADSDDVLVERLLQQSREAAAAWARRVRPEADPRIVNQAIGAFHRQVLEFKTAASVYDQLCVDVISEQQIAELPPQEWLIDGWIPRGSLAQIWGKHASLKSFLALSMHMALTRDLSWFDKTVNPASCLYIVGEGVLGYGKRIAAWNRAYGFPPRVKSSLFVKRPVNLRHDEDADALRRYIVEQGFQVLIIDTLARNTPGMDENGPEMGAFVARLDRIRADLDLTIIVIHHANAAQEKSRGHTSLPGALDVDILVRRTKGGCSVSLEKQKDGADGIRLHLLMDVIDVREDELEEPSSSVVLRLSPDEAIDSIVQDQPSRNENRDKAWIAISQRFNIDSSWAAKGELLAIIREACGVGEKQAERYIEDFKDSDRLYQERQRGPYRPSVHRGTN